MKHYPLTLILCLIAAIGCFAQGEIIVTQEQVEVSGGLQVDTITSSGDLMINPSGGLVVDTEHYAMKVLTHTFSNTSTDWVIQLGELFENCKINSDYSSVHIIANIFGTSQLSGIGYPHRLVMHASRGVTGTWHQVIVTQWHQHAQWPLFTSAIFLNSTLTINPGLTGRAIVQLEVFSFSE